MAKRSLICFVSAASVLVGCATSPVPMSEALDVPADRIIDRAAMQPKIGAGMLVVKRDLGVTGGGCKVRVFVDARPIADLATGEKIELYLPVGERIVSVTPQSALCSSALVETAVHVSGDQKKALRIGFGASMDLLLQPTAF